MRCHTLLSFVCAGLLLTSCSDDEPTAADRDWAEQATLQIARVNDIIALEFLPAVLGDAYSDEPIVEVDGTQTPNWVDLQEACSHLAPLVPGIDAVADEAPERYADAGENLREYGVTLGRVAKGCGRSARAEDFESLRDEVNPDIERLVPLVEAIGSDLPGDISCPEAVDERPQSCDA